MEFFTQLRLLLCKNLLILWRTKFKTVAEIVVGLLVSVPVVSIIADHATSQKMPEQEFDSFRVSGDWRDLNRRLGYLKTINSFYCAKNKYIGITFRPNVSIGETQRFSDALQTRYNNSASGAFNITVKIFNSEQDLNRVLIDDLNRTTVFMKDLNRTVECGSYMGGIIFKRFDLMDKRLSYAIRLHDEIGLHRKWDTDDEVWVKGGPFTILSDLNLVPGQPNYWSTGFISLQFAIDSLFLQAVKGWQADDSSSFRLLLRRMPEAAYFEKSVMNFLLYLASFWPLIATLSINFTVAIVSSEKESAVKTYLTVMGLRSSVFYTSHTIIAFIKICIIILPSAIILLPVLMTVSPSLFLFMTLLYCAGATTFSMFITSVFHTSAGALKGVNLLWVISFALSSFVPSPNHVFLLLLCSLHVNCALWNAIVAIQDYMNRDMELNWSNCFEGSTQTFSLGLALTMTVVDILWMWLLTIYLDHVYPPNQLPRKHPLYFLPSWMFDPESENEKAIDWDETDMENENIEAEDGRLNNEAADVEVRHLTKIYGLNRAVDALSFTAYRGNVTVLLGHNGAGKSTTFSILTGLTNPSAGSIRICGTDLNPTTLRLCQKNIGFCPQYNPLFKLLTVREHLQLIRKLKNNSDDCVDELIDELQLHDKADILSENLSGGMKRKLCVAMSLVGGSRVVLLDEPTAGMDPGARHHVEELLERCKTERTILLTTHFMDEADVLGDRISIMAKGRLACAGTSDFLKTRFGTGYLLVIALNDRRSVPNRLDKLMKMIRTFVENAQIQSATAQQITVLLPVEYKPKFSQLFAQLEESDEEYGVSSFGVSLNTLEQVFLKVGEMAEPNTRGKDTVDMARRQAAQICDQSNKYRSGVSMLLWQLCALLRKRLVCTLRLWSRLIHQLFIPVLLLAVFAYLLNRPPKRDYDKEVVMNAGQLAPSVIPLQFRGQLPGFSNNVTRIVNAIPDYTIRAIPAEDDMSRVIIDTPKVLPPLGVAIVAENRTANQTSVEAFFNAKARRGPVIALSLVSNARLGIDPDSIVASLYPYEIEDSPFAGGLPGGIQLAVVSPMILFVFSLLTCAFVMLPIDERVSNFMHQQLLTPLSPFTYWISMILSDLFIYSLACSLFLVIFSVSGWMLEHKADVALLWLLYFWCWLPFIYIVSFLIDQAPKAYAALITYSAVVPIVALILKFIMGVYLPKIQPVYHTMCLLLLPPYAMSYGFWIIIGYEISPLLMNALTAAGDGIDYASIYSWDQLGRILTLMAVSGVVYWAVLMAIQTRRIARFFHALWRIPYRSSSVSDEENNNDEEDVDVRQERHLVNSASSDDFVLSVHNLNKYYGKLHAVKNLTFGVRADECFGLLGINGAGKTTTFDMLTGISIPDSGTAAIDGRSINQRQIIGFCPQFDALLGCLTGRETLSVMASLCGFADVSSRVDTVLDAVALKPQANQLIKSFSGGQRRRLSVGLALITQARLIILDEPTAGIDPKTRRQIWDLLSAMREQRCAMLLTSHSMDECEVLCTRIGIMHSGCLVAIGSAQHIKSRYGEGYTLTFTITDSSLGDDLVNEVRSVFPNAVLRTIQNSTHMVWHLTRSDSDRWSELFAKARNLADSKSWITDYSLAQATLEEAFLRLSQANESDVAQQTVVSITPSSTSPRADGL